MDGADEGVGTGCIQSSVAGSHARLSLTGVREAEGLRQQ